MKKFGNGTIVLLILVLAFCLQTLRGEPRQWKEMRSNDEVILIRPGTETADPAGTVFARKGDMTTVRLAQDLGTAGQAGASDLERYLPLAVGARVEISGKIKARARGAYTLLLATTRSSDLLSWAGLENEAQGLGEQDCRIIPIQKFPDGARGLALVGGSPRGLLNGLYTLLEKSAGLWWDPSRVGNHRKTAVSEVYETTLNETDELRWSGQALLWKPAVAERVLYTGYESATKNSVDWASRNRLSHLVIATPHDLPMPEAEEKRLLSVVEHAHGRGLHVLFLGMTHRLPANQVSLKPSTREALDSSTKLYLDMFVKFRLDGMAWHSASEGITLAEDEAYNLKPRAYWESLYFNSYYAAIRNVRKDALLVMLMGWVYVNPAAEMSRLFPPDTVAWVVPNTPIIDAAITDLDEYGRYFKHLWYWLYVTVSQDGAFPVVKLDYLEKYFAEAFKRGHNLAPQGTLNGTNSANAMYFVRVARDGLVPHPEFLQSFAERYYGDARMAKALLDYQNALVFHRNWYSNIHTAESKNYLTWEERAMMHGVFETTMAAAREAKSPLVRDRLKTLAVTALRCIVRGSPLPPSPPETRKEWNPQQLKRYQSQLEEYCKMIGRLGETFPDPYFGEADDFFGQELKKIGQFCRHD